MKYIFFSGSECCRNRDSKTRYSNSNFEQKKTYSAFRKLNDHRESKNSRARCRNLEKLSMNRAPRETIRSNGRLASIRINSKRGKRVTRLVSCPLRGCSKQLFTSLQLCRTFARLRSNFFAVTGVALRYIETIRCLMRDARTSTVSLRNYTVNIRY